MPSARVKRFIRRTFEINREKLINRDYRDDISDTFPEYLPKEWIYKRVSLGEELFKWTVYAFVYYYGEDAFIIPLSKWFAERGIDLLIPEDGLPRYRVSVTKAIEHIEKRIDSIEAQLSELRTLLEHLKSIAESGIEMEVDFAF